MDPPAQPRYSFGPFLLDPVEKVLLRDDEPVPLPPKALETLCALVEGHGHILEKAELLNRIWPDTFVEEATLAQNIFTLRKALGDSAEGHRYIETVPRRGYRFVAPIRELTDDPRQNRPPTQTTAIASRPTHRWATRVSAAVVVLVLWATAYLARQRFWPSPRAERVTLVVLPFQNMTGDPQQEYLTDGLTEEMIAQVSRMDPERLGVIARTSAMQYKGTTKNVAQIGRELGVSYILESSFRREGNRVRITAQLVRVSDQTHLWSQNYERDVREILALESEVTQAIANEIRIKVSAQDRSHLASASPVDPEAHQLYLKGRFFWNKRTEAGYVKAISYFQSAIERSPRYAQANAGLADTYALLGSMPNEEISRAEAMSKAKAAAISALQLDDSLAEAHTSLAFVKMHYDWDWNGAEQEFGRAIELDPNYPTAHHWYAYDLAALNRMREALNEIWRAQQVDPLSAIISTDVAEFLYYAGRYDQAIQQAKAALEIDPQFLMAHSLLGEIYGEQHRYSEALAEGKRAVELSGGSPWMLARLGRTYALSGDRSQAEQVLRQLVELSAKRKGMSGKIAGVAAALGKNDEAFAAVQKACEERDGGLMLLKYDHTWDLLRSDPRFQELVRRVGLPQ